MELLYILVFLLTLTIESVILTPDCGEGCSNCQSANRCTQCTTSYYLASDRCHKCPSNCETCDNYNTCTSCKPKFYNLESQCRSPCTFTCLNKHCEDTTGNCVNCPVSRYGLKCLRNCTLCQNEQCDLRVCSHGCKSGYYAFHDGTETYCQPCPFNCLSCRNTKVCDICEAGYYPNKFELNDQIYVNCVFCSNSTSCSTYCVMENCINCQVVEANLRCTECVNGYIFDGDQCAMIQHNCSEGCSNSCNETGACLGSCNVGWSGDGCSNKCNDRCKECHRDDANYCEQCKGDFYTTTCDKVCSNNCIIKANQQTCDINTGYCLNGCNRNYWGDGCTEGCSEGCADDGGSEICDRNNGKCSSGCKDGYTGDHCSNVSSQPEETHTTIKNAEEQSKTEATTAIKETTDGGNTDAVEQKKDNSNMTTVAGAAGGGGLILIIAVVMVVFFVRKRRGKNTEQNDEDIRTGDGTSDNTTNTGDATAYLYAQPMKASKKQKNEVKQDYIYAQPNKPKKRTHHSKKEIGNPENLYANIAIDLDEEQETTTETNVDILQLESLDEGVVSFIETEVQLPTTDIYYNTASFKRSRIQVSNLKEYVETKTDFDKEFEKLPKGLTRPCNEAMKPNNIAKNRYKGIYAYDATRVTLKRRETYVNANYIEGHRKSPEYIASLGPTSEVMNKFETFWEMIWQEKTDIIVMLTHLEEDGKMKCEQYWPEQGKSVKYGDYKVFQSSVSDFSEFVVREFTLIWQYEERKVTQYHYIAWPDKTVPETVSSLVEFRDKVEQTQSTNAGPMVVHCSAGIGRTGTYIALDMLIREGRDDNYVDIFECVTGLRGQRAHIVQNLEQYIYLHHCVLYALTCDPQPRSGTSIKQMTEPDITSQYQAYIEMKKPPNKDRKSIALNKSRKENRKGADIPGDGNRVRLTLTKQDYINAVYVNGYAQADKFIVAQTPLPNTAEEFVSMLYQTQCACVVCLDEEHINEKAIGQYLPPANKVSDFEHFQVFCKKTETKDNFVVRELNISQLGSPSGDDVTTIHYQFKDWKESDNVPSSVSDFLKLVVDTERARKKMKSDKPIVVQCLNGSYKSSVFAAVAIMLEKYTIEKEQQLKFSYDFMKEILKDSSSSDYYNTLDT